jgi:hypothetical protein
LDIDMTTTTQLSILDQRGQELLDAAYAEFEHSEKHRDLIAKVRSTPPDITNENATNIIKESGGIEAILDIALTGMDLSARRRDAMHAYFIARQTAQAGETPGL